MKMFYISYLAMTIGLMAMPQLPSPSIYRIDSGRSSLNVDVFRGGLFKTLGHDHTVAARKFSGTVQFDPGKLRDSSVSLSIESSSLTVLDPHASEKERSEVQATMEGLKVLGVQAFPKIEFSSTRVSEVTQAGNGFAITLTGRLSLHGIEREITFPVHISFEKNLLRAAGSASITQTDFGIVPIRLGGGTVRVKDQVKVNFDLLAERAG